MTGTVYEPAGKTPLYNVIVYVPNAPLDPIPEGATCDQCGSVSGDPVVTALTDTAGKFVLEDVPVGNDIPMVIQVGKWRRELTIPSVGECVDTPLTDVESTSLPSNQNEGHIPKIALTTGGADSLECWLRKIGLEDSEFTPETGSGRINLYGGSDGAAQYAPSMNGGVPLTTAQTFWSNPAAVNSYDIVLLSCEGDQFVDTKPQVALQAMHDYASLGGRVFASHWHNVWLQLGPPGFSSVATWNFFQGDPPDPFNTLIDQSFPKGEAMAQWLTNVGASTVPGELLINEPRTTIGTIDANLTRRWIYGQQFPAVQYFSFNTPVGAPDDELCGRVVFSDLHVSAADQEGAAFPSGCLTTDLSPQEKALLFMLFDLSSCIDPDEDPTPPAPK